ncbi:hypothetical protein TNCV_4805911 [Trichonephila clavipes]|nr:hypothetical protein TNCV_4805911 [Trichonephila clavipes]
MTPPQPSENSLGSRFPPKPVPNGSLLTKKTCLPYFKLTTLIVQKREFLSITLPHPPLPGVVADGWKMRSRLHRVRLHRPGGAPAGRRDSGGDEKNA